MAALRRGTGRHGRGVGPGRALAEAIALVLVPLWAVAMLARLLLAMRVPRVEQVPQEQHVDGGATLRYIDVRDADDSATRLGSVHETSPQVYRSVCSCRDFASVPVTSTGRAVELLRGHRTSGGCRLART